MAQLFLLDTPVSENEREQLEAQAHERGYTTIGEYLLALAKADAQLDSLDDETDEEIDVESRLRQALADVKAGRVYPYDKLREMIENDVKNERTDISPTKIAALIREALSSDT